ncbi:MAG: ATP-binding protein, partial [Bacteroidota bacterium]
TNNDGKWNSEIVSMKINVEPPFWETNWFRFLLISLIAGVALLIHNIRLRYLNRQNLLLEREIKERTKEIEVKNEELTETVEELKSTQEQLVISEKMAALGQLTASVAHEVNTPLGAINSAVDSIQVDLPEVIQEFPLLARVFTESEFNAFSDILENSDEVPFLSTKETRKRRKEIESELDKKGINNGHILASYLVGLNVDIKSNAFNTLVRHKYAPVIFQTASKIINVKNLAGNIGISVQQASKVAFALKRYTHNSHNASKEQFDLRENVLGVLSIFKSQLHNIELNLELGEKIIINGHPSELSQVWLNLIQNAIHAINGKGRIEIEAIPNGRNVNMRISDNGIGIPDEIKDKIFDPFFTTKPYGQGSGLGLDIVNKIIKRHQGSISFDSDKSGTVFKLVLPYDNDTKE